MSIEAMKQALELLAVATFHSPELQAKRTEVIERGLQAITTEESSAVQEHVATVADLYPYRRRSCGLPEDTKLYTYPPQRSEDAKKPKAEQEPKREWVGLNTEEVCEVWSNFNSGLDTAVNFYNAIESKLKEKNT